MVRVIGTSLDNNYRDDLNYNFGLLSSTINNIVNGSGSDKDNILEMIDNLQKQINAIAGGEIGDLLNRVNQAVIEADIAAKRAEQAATDSEETTQLANAAAALANANAIVAEQAAIRAEKISDEMVILKEEIEVAKDNAIEASEAINEVLPNFQYLENKTSWKPNVTYVKNNFVFFEGNGYMALKQTLGNRPPLPPTYSNEYWSLYAERGSNGADAPGLNIIGQLNDENDLPSVGKEGDAYLIKGEFWIWSKTTNSWVNAGNIKGEKGDKGDKGDTGNTGPKGDKGDKGDNDVYINNGALFSASPSSYENGLTITRITTNPINGSYLGWRNPILAKIGADESGTALNFLIETFRRAGAHNVHQRISAYSNISGTPGKLMFMVSRSSYMDKWEDLSIEFSMLTGDGNPEGKENALSGSIYYDYTNKKYYSRKKGVQGLASTGWVEVAESNSETQLYQGDLNNLVVNGFYSCDSSNTTSLPRTGSITGRPWLVSVVADAKGETTGLTQFAIQTADEETIHFRVRTITGTWTAWVMVPRGLNNTLTSTSTTQAATANAVKQVNDKIESPVVELQALEGWNSIAEGDYLKVFKIGKVVTFSGKITLTVSNNSYSRMALLPVGYRPLGTIIVPVSGSTKKNTIPPSFFHGVINESGYLSTGADLVAGTGTQISDLTIGNKYSFTTSFIVN